MATNNIRRKIAMLIKGSDYRTKQAEKIERHSRPNAPVPGMSVREEAKGYEKASSKPSETKEDKKKKKEKTTVGGSGFVGAHKVDDTYKKLKK